MRVGVLGASGRMGRASCRAVLGAGDLELVAAVARASAGSRLRELVAEAPDGLAVRATPADLLEAKAEAVIDFSVPEATMEAARLLLPAGVHVVSGTTGLSPEAMEELGELAADRGNGNAVWAPNYALGAVLAQRFATIAARYYPDAEVIELHHAGKADAPSGTALRTARSMASARETSGGEASAWERSRREGAAGEAPVRASRELVSGARGGEVGGVRVHSVRLPGLVAHQEVIFGGQGELLTLRHDSLDLSSFMPGVLLCVRDVPNRPGLTIGLEPLLDLE
jgi:4-hydroxy-tetrahydrodipicolinate reductase